MISSGTTAILRAAERWRGEGHSVVLATVVETWGSAPRRPGGHMMVCATGDFVGSVSGGCVEAAVVEEAKGVMKSGRAHTVEYGVADEDAWAVGLACGGQVRIHLEPVGPEGLGDALLGEVIAAREDHEPVVLATGLTSGTHALLRPFASAGQGQGDTTPWDAARNALLSDQSVVVDTSDGEVFLRPHNRPVRVIIVGAVHLAQALVPMVVAAGFDAVVVDPRDAFATAERFPGVDMVSSWPGEALRSLRLDHRTAVVVVTHDPKLDDPALTEALATDVFYVGALGSRRTHARRLERLEAEGVSTEALTRIHAPVGLDIGARTPGEISVAIVAEIVAALRGRRREP